MQHSQRCGTPRFRRKAFTSHKGFVNRHTRFLHCAAEALQPLPRWHGSTRSTGESDPAVPQGKQVLSCLLPSLPVGCPDRDHGLRIGRGWVNDDCWQIVTPTPTDFAVFQKGSHKNQPGHTISHLLSEPGHRQHVMPLSFPFNASIDQLYPGTLRGADSSVEHGCCIGAVEMVEDDNHRFTSTTLFGSTAGSIFHVFGDSRNFSTQGLAYVSAIVKRL